MENQTNKKMANEMETGLWSSGLQVFPNNGECILSRVGCLVLPSSDGGVQDQQLRFRFTSSWSKVQQVRT